MSWIFDRLCERSTLLWIIQALAVIQGFPIWVLVLLTLIGVFVADGTVTKGKCDDPNH